MTATLEKLLGGALLRDVPLSKYTAARIGGAAEMLYVAKGTNEQLAEVVQTAWQAQIPVRVIGGGANILVSDAGVRGLVIVNQVKELHFGQWHGGRTVSVSAGVSLTHLANRCASQGLTGFEWAVSVPGTVGGAVVNNAGAHGGDMQGCVRDVVMIDAQRGAQMLSLADLAYDYRTSALKRRTDRRFLVLMANLALAPAPTEEIRAQMQAFVARRKQTQPSGASLGSIFKNPTGDYAGRLIEAAGLKGFQIGGAAVSDVHANFFINAHHASATDYLALVEHVQQVVYAQFGVWLEPEIERIGE